MTKKFKEYLYELFDKPYGYSRDLKMEEKVRLHLSTNSNYKDHKFGAVKVYKMDEDQGHIVHVIRNKYHELHHIAADNSSGESEPRLEHAKPRFIGTMMKYAKEHVLDQNRSLKISATKQMHHALKPIIEKVARKNGHEIEHGEEIIGNHETHFTIVKPKNDIHPMKECLSVLIT